MIKANAYGHGAVEVAKFLASQGVERVGVSLVEEALQLRLQGIKMEILVFGAFNDLQSAKACNDHSLTPVISSHHQLNSLEQIAADQELNFHLKFDTGMNRLGFSVLQAQQLRSHLAKYSKWTLKGICTHLMKGEDAKDLNGKTAKQI